MSGATTEAVLRDWRFGQTQAERLVAGLLQLDGFKEVDPQHPLGGPDGLKDVLCTKAGVRWVAAAYFPPTRVTFAAITKKFDKDVQGVAANGAIGFAFFVNQRVSDTERKQLRQRSPAQRNEIFHLERMVHLLNSSKGFGLRLEHLRIPMTPEEQWSHRSETTADILQRLDQVERSSHRRFGFVHKALDRLEVRTRAIAVDLGALPTTIGLRPRLKGVEEPPTATLTIGQLCWLHRIVTDRSGMPDAYRGRLRESDDVWIGAKDVPNVADNVVPVLAARITLELSQLLEWWHATHSDHRGASKNKVAHALADFHHRFFLIHPFFDGNGRVARLLLDQAARELLGRGVSHELTAPPADYYSALAHADRGDLEPLRQRILEALEEPSAP
jgi:Fic/DOC family